MNKILAFITISISFMLLSCTPSIDSQEAMRYNNIGINKSHTDIDSALYYFDKAIERDSNYLLAHQNKVNLYIKAQRYNEALHEAEILSTKTENAEILRIKGLLYEITLDSVRAKVNYIKTIEAIDEEVKRVNDFMKYQKLFQKGTIQLLLSQHKEGIDLIEKYSSKANVEPSKKDSIISFQNNKNGLVKILLQP